MIGLITFHGSHNHGSMLQAYATQKSIENIGKVYCPGTYMHWAGAVKGMMKSSFNKI